MPTKWTKVYFWPTLSISPTTTSTVLCSLSITQFITPILWVRYWLEIYETEFENVCMEYSPKSYYLLTQTIIPVIRAHASTKVGHGASSSRFIGMRDTRRLRGLCCHLERWKLSLPFSELFVHNLSPEFTVLGGVSPGLRRSWEAPLKSSDSTKLIR